MTATSVFRIVYIFVKFLLKHLCAVCKDGINFKILIKTIKMVFSLESGMNADTCILRLVCDSHLARQIVHGKVGGP